MPIGSLKLSNNSNKKKIAYSSIVHNQDVTRVFEDAETCGIDYNIFINLCIKIIDKGYKRPMFNLDKDKTFKSFTPRLNEYVKMLKASNYNKRKIAYSIIKDNENIKRVFEDVESSTEDYYKFLSICTEILVHTYFYF